MAVRAVRCLPPLLGLASLTLAEDCRLALVLALVVSNSVDSHENRLQRGDCGMHFSCRRWFELSSKRIWPRLTCSNGQALCIR